MKYSDIQNGDTITVKTKFGEDLGWEHQRMTESGKLSYKRLTAMLGWEFES